MTLRASKNRKSPTLGLLGTTLHKNIGSIILLSIAMLIFCPGFFLTVLSKTTFRPQNYDSPEALGIVYGVTTVLSCIFVCLANYVNFSYLYKKNSSDVFAALPLTRNGMLFSRMAAGFIGVLVPVTIGYIALAFLTVSFPTYAVGTVAQIASAYLVNILLMLAFSAFSMIFIICAGSGFDLVLSFCGFNVAVLAVGGIIHALCHERLSGYSMVYTGFLRILSPIYYLAEKAVLFADNKYSLSVSGELIFGIIKYAVVFLIISFILYAFRKSERTEQAYAYKFIFIICGVLAGICGGYGLSQIFILAAGRKSFSVIGFVSFIAGALITTVVYGAVTDRGFKGFKRSMAIGAGSAVVYGIIAIIIVSGAFGFEKRIPEKSKITAATVSFDDEIIDFNNPDDVLALHNAIINKGADDNYEDTVDTPHTYVELNYNLSDKGSGGNGDFVREYFVDKTKVKKELFKIYSGDARFSGFEKTIDKSSNSILEIWGTVDNREESVNLDGHITRTEAKKLLEVYKSELRAAGDKIFSVDGQTNTVMTVCLIVDKSDSASEQINFYTTSDFPKTNKILEGFKAEEET